MRCIAFAHHAYVIYLDVELLWTSHADTNSSREGRGSYVRQFERLYF
jgi:hypothetical protein